ncbi:MAG: FGGY family carbohydrate kinase [Armatimonadota bacterium]|nr:FGGY family carbohydrate kinase [Armatimonadota bacterium]MDR7500388.1 FGGY family carbohydrate kinase [Armatimonadota bacterium]MDR7548048.1 FGGY family carbohydrate kinase [Armatimonadota bacterium]
MAPPGSLPHVLAIDLGTTHLKAATVDPKGRLIRTGLREVAIHFPRPGWVEQDPYAYWGTVVDLVREVASGSAVEAVVLTGQRGSLIFVDGDGRPISAVVTWLDRRSENEAASLRAAIDRMPEARGVILRRGPSVLSKVRWFSDHEPETVRRAARVLISVKDFVLYQLIGRWVTDIPQASLSGFYDTGRRSWHREVVAFGGLTPLQLIDLESPVAIAGKLGSDIAAALDLPPGLPVVVGCGDAEAAHLGLGALDLTTASMNLGTIGAVRATCGSLPARKAETFACVDMWPIGWIIGAMVRTAGALVRWLRDVWIKEPGWEFLAEAVRIPAGADGLLVLPHFSGSGHPDIPQARGVIFGLALHHHRAHVIRACLEGVAIALAEALTDLEEATGVRSRIRISGGGVRSPLWLQIVADACNRPLEVPVASEASLVGAAMMAMVAIGVYPDLLAAASSMVHVDRVVTPDPASAGVYREVRSKARHLMEALRPHFEAVVSPLPRETL